MERFYHIRAQKSGTGQVLNNGGATVHLESIEGDPLHVRMRVTYCNPDDVFNKKLGREFCVGRPARDREIHRRNPATGEVYVELIHDPVVWPKDQSIISLRSIPTELGKVWRTVHRRMKEPLDQGISRPFDHRLREWLPKE